MGIIISTVSFRLKNDHFKTSIEIKTLNSCTQLCTIWNPGTSDNWNNIREDTFIALTSSLRQRIVQLISEKIYASLKENKVQWGLLL